MVGMSSIQERLRVDSYVITVSLRREAAAHIDALEERCAAYKGQVEAGAKRIDTLESELASEKARVAELEGALVCAEQDINWMLNNRKFLNAAVFYYIDAALEPGEG